MRSNPAAILLALALACCSLTLTHCKHLPAVLSAVAQASQLMGSAIDVAESGSAIYFARHPHEANQAKVARAVMIAQGSRQALDSALLAAQAADAGDVPATREAARKTYTQLVELLESLGIPEARGPAGGAEVDTAPPPEPFELPDPSELRL